MIPRRFDRMPVFLDSPACFFGYAAPFLMHDLKPSTVSISPWQHYTSWQARCQLGVTTDYRQAPIFPSSCAGSRLREHHSSRAIGCPYFDACYIVGGYGAVFDDRTTGTWS